MQSRQKRHVHIYLIKLVQEERDTAFLILWSQSVRN